MNQPPSPKLIRKIGFGYALDFLPTPLLVGFNQLRKKLERARFKVAVSLVPLNDVPSDLDLLIVPIELEETARTIVRHQWIIALDNFFNHPTYAELLKKLEEGQEIYALRGEAERTEEGGVIERYRGYERIE